LQELSSITPQYVKEHIVSRDLHSRKGDNGIVLIVGGSSLYHGAPILASMAALRCGADLVYTGIPKSISQAVRSHSPNIIALPMPADSLTVGSTNRLLGMLPKTPHTAAIGMGMSISKPEALSLLVKKLIDNGTKLLLDASALIPNVLSILSGSSSIVTPHAGEYKRLFGEDPGSTEEALMSNVSAMAKKYRITIILKGWLNVIADPDQNVAKIVRSTPAMTVGGSGDVLDGIASNFFAKMKSFDASVLAVYFNGLAASLAVKKLGTRILATDLIEFLPEAIKAFDN